MARKKNDDFEARLERLGKIVEELEKGDLPLERGVALFKEGRTLAKACRKQLEEAKNEVKVVSEGMVTDFEPENTEMNGDDGD
jgi:exodeoxyribonuclease VII small subunit